jgi:hypothetical protein
LGQRTATLAKREGVMAVSRRRLFSSLTLAAAYSAAAETKEPALTMEVLRSVSAAHGKNLSDDRLRVLKPVLERRLPRLRALRSFEFDDKVEPVQGILNK